MSLPKQAVIHELGPREGMQIEKNFIPTEEKIRLIDLLSECNLPEIEATSFVSPKWVPNMADAAEVVAGMTRREGTRYTAIYLNTQGIDRAIATGKLDMEGVLSITASETFSKKNTNRTIEETFVETEKRVRLLKDRNVPADQISVMAAFGCNYEGNVAPEHVVRLIDRLMTMADDNGLKIELIQLADTMGWATPSSIQRLVGMVQDRWPSTTINLHLHDTRGLGIVNAFTALKMGVYDFDAAVGGLGGCPYAGFKGAAGNIATEDLVHLCQEEGIETGVDLERLLEVARVAEEIIGRPLPGKIMRGGALETTRTRLAN
jgi:hydroxymethylglutaryl-CoA lyase